MFGLCFLFLTIPVRSVRPIISAFSYRTKLHKIYGVDKTMTADEGFEVSFSISRGTLLWNQFLLGLSASIHRIRFACHSADGGVRQEVQVLRWTQANQITHRLTRINR